MTTAAEIKKLDRNLEITNRLLQPLGKSSKSRLLPLELAASKQQSTPADVYFGMPKPTTQWTKPEGIGQAMATTSQYF